MIISKNITSNKHLKITIQRYLIQAWNLGTKLYGLSNHVYRQRLKSSTHYMPGGALFLFLFTFSFSYFFFFFGLRSTKASQWSIFLSLVFPSLKLHVFTPKTNFLRHFWLDAQVYLTPDMTQNLRNIIYDL